MSGTLHERRVRKDAAFVSRSDLISMKYGTFALLGDLPQSGRLKPDVDHIISLGIDRPFNAEV